MLSIIDERRDAQLLMETKGKMTRLDVFFDVVLV